MGLVIIFGLVTIIALLGFFREIRRKNFLAVVFTVLTVAVFGWFTINTLVSLITSGGGTSH
ncbi:DUF2759 domain-containing protein [Bacillus marinisedimentorum]|uniref:DUF2759 domain-containing protein n=1 Tax=Bacillus marinisedimentorum TaxID=1821260 RepID=UPI000873141D|nr:DUF2759 domain-containing protein [Bacillus marinisedimentorum]